MLDLNFSIPSHKRAGLGTYILVQMICQLTQTRVQNHQSPKDCSLTPHYIFYFDRGMMEIHKLFSEQIYFEEAENYGPLDYHA